MANQPWFKQDPQKSARDRAAQIAKMRDPGTFADEMLIGAKWLLYLSLLFTGALCYFSYRFFLERFLDPTAAITAAALVTVLIEYGKQRIGLNAIRMPFLQGWRFITQSQENTFMFAGASIFAVLIFSISVYNSTNGAAKYAEQTAYNKTERVFTANTQDLDAQIAATQERLSNAPKAKWKGREYYQDPKAVREAEKTLASLQQQRATVHAQQRADFERGRDNGDNANNHAASIALRVGGWLEAVQIVLLLLIASCERVLDRRMQNAPTPSQQQGGSTIGFRTNTAVATNQTGAENTTNTPQQRNQIGFQRYDTATQTVPQHTQSVAQHKGLLTGDEADNAIRYHLTALKREPSNMKNPYANKESVYRRMVNCLLQIQQTLNGVGWCSTKVYAEVYDYMEASVLPAMREHGFDYNTAELYTLLYSRAKAPEA